MGGGQAEREARVLRKPRAMGGRIELRAKPRECARRIHRRREAATRREGIDGRVRGQRRRRGEIEAPFPARAQLAAGKRHAGANGRLAGCHRKMISPSRSTESMVKSTGSLSFVKIPRETVAAATGADSRAVGGG